MTARVAVLGFATLDYVLSTRHPLNGTGTVDAHIFADDAWPRAGGAALYACRRLSAHGHAAWPIVSVGTDIHAEAYRQACRQSDVRVDGVVERPGEKTPCCLLVYHDNGGYTCLLDLGSVVATYLSDAQRKLVADADMIVVAAADPVVISRALDHLSADQQVAWIVKDDPACFPPALRRELVRHADVIFCNASEYHLIDAFLIGAKPDMILFETHGAEGVRVRSKAMECFVAASPVAVHDATGAGDTFAGEALAHLLAGRLDLLGIAQHAVDQVAAMLAARQRAIRKPDWAQAVARESPTNGR
ncbi:carbohydrate kinase family protein [Sphingobium sp. CR2-8]|uniref:carbohydrate kinase family protein n=1 Tax=Sphingobium sp. CR2-8 TaxID=1306534 RepID=UPI002DBF8193|nr:carbohydrate kinase family protein [Sphingobium sp. CR2-8]MEC3909796.1 carbohydrate kinase family protein [Sphingobium sp. CR2-8]